MNHSEDPSRESDPKEGSDNEHDRSNSSNGKLKAYLKNLAEQIWLKRLMTDGCDYKIDLVQSDNAFAFSLTDPKTNQSTFIPAEIPADICSGQHFSLAREAKRLKKAWLMAVAIIGKDVLQIPDLGEYFFTDYFLDDDEWLEREIVTLRDDFDSLAKLLLTHWNPGNLYNASSWLAEQYDHYFGWIAKRLENPGYTAANAHSIGRVYEVEQQIGALGIRKYMDCPPYAQVVIQGFFGAGVRHPEYHLASDLALQYNLFLDSHGLMIEALLRGALPCSQNSQSLGRAVIQTCFSLLEAFITGLASAFVYENPKAPQRTINLLKGIGPDGKYLNWRVDEKFARFPTLITGSGNLDMDKPPFQKLFGRYKKQRNAFAHPSMPFDVEDEYRVQNEARFHDITLEGVRETVELTCEAIGVVWKMLYGKPKPSWLPPRQSNGRFEGVTARLVPVNPTAHGGDVDHPS